MIRGSGDEVRSYFNQLAGAPETRERSAFGRPFDGAGFERFGGEPGRVYRLCLRTVAMGDLNAVDVAQATHHQLLRNAGCLDPREELVDGTKLPLSQTF